MRLIPRCCCSLFPCSCFYSASLFHSYMCMKFYSFGTNSPEQWRVQITSVIDSYSCCMVVYKTSRQTHISVCFFHLRYFNFVRFACTIYITSRSIYGRDVDGRHICWIVCVISWLLKQKQFKWLKSECRYCIQSSSFFYFVYLCRLSDARI